MSAARTALALLDTNPADGLRATASLLRERAPRDAPRMSLAAADLFDESAREIERRVFEHGTEVIEAMNGTGRALIEFARAYLDPEGDQ